MLGENPYLGGNCLSGCLQVSKFHFSFSPPPLPIPWWSFQHYSVGADFGILFMLLLKPLESCWKHPRLSCSAASTRIGYSWSDHGIYITGKCKSIYTKKKRKEEIGLELLKINITSIPLYKNAFEVVVILFGPMVFWDLGQ